MDLRFFFILLIFFFIRGHVIILVVDIHIILSQISRSQTFNEA